MPTLPPVLPLVGPPGPGGTTSFKVLDILRLALIKIGVLDPNEPLEGQSANQALVSFNMMLDSWNADGRFIYAKQFMIGTIQPNLQPHLIGPTGTPGFVVQQRPVKILAANILLNYPGPTTVRVRVEVQDDMWWANNLAPAIASVIPTDLYYEPDWPNGSMFLWVVPTVAYPLELEVWSILQQLQLDAAFSLPPGYMLGIVYALAEILAPDFDADWTPALEKMKNKALQRIQGPNLVSPRLGTCDAGIPGKRAGNRSNYNYLTKQFNQ